MSDLTFILSLLSALGSGLIAGAFFAFSAFVMRALGKLPAHEGIAAMQSINIVVINPWFMVVFLGTVVTSVVLAVTSIINWSSAGSGYLLAGCLLYVAGTFLVTIVFNVPLNNAIAAVDPSSPEGAAVWSNYLTNWTLWNTVRTIASTLALASFILGLVNRQ